jgi:basic membrane lipoprotein Med (substrate-binding protein (PBP1-ABC) superfamily)
MGDALSTVAKQFADTNFAFVDFPWAALKDKPANARGLVFAELEAGYLVGVAAATAAGAARSAPWEARRCPPSSRSSPATARPCRTPTPA